MVVILKSTSVMLLWYSSNYVLMMFFKGKLRDLQTLLRYLREIVNSTFKAGDGVCGGCGDRGGWVPSGFCGDCGGRGGISPVISFINDLLSEALSLRSTSSILSL